MGLKKHKNELSSLLAGHTSARATRIATGWSARTKRAARYLQSHCAARFLLDETLYQSKESGLCENLQWPKPLKPRHRPKGRSLVRQSPRDS